MPFDRVRRAVAEHVARSWSEVPRVTQGDRADITELEGFRHRFGADEGEHLTLTAILVAVVARALTRFSHFNAAVDAEANELVLRHDAIIGVAVDTDHGLLVPVVRDAAKKGLLEIGAELADLAERARDRALRADELEGASFTITNLGGLGTTTFTPIVGWPQVAILGVGRARTLPVHREEVPRPVPSDETFVARRILPLSLAYDHRAVDGADAARFLRWICRALEEPLRLIG